jgi:hypothetical protein
VEPIRHLESSLLFVKSRAWVLPAREVSRAFERSSDMAALKALVLGGRPRVSR